MKITLKDGSVKSYENAMTAADVCKDLSMGLYRAACCCRIRKKAKSWGKCLGKMSLMN